MKIRFVVFDLTGTLTDQHSALERIEEDFDVPFLGKMGFVVRVEDFKKAREEADREAEKNYIKTKGVYDTVLWTKSICRRLSIPYSKELFEEWNVEFRKYMDSRLKLMEGAKGVLEYLKGKGYGVFLFTNSTRKSAEIKLEKFGIGNCFDFVFVSEEIGAKSSIQPFKTILEKIGAKAEECIMVGNRMDEDMFAKKAGMKTVLLEDARQKYFKETEEPDYRIRKLEEIKEVL
ncbi:MAG: HAD family hydrolase [Nanoarchaeota archaeon]|nr:HAD family hydrolase [Nanoarchaeota archaeon]